MSSEGGPVEGGPGVSADAPTDRDGAGVGGASATPTGELSPDAVSWRRMARLAVGAATLLAVGLTVTAPRAWMYDEVVEENHALKNRLEVLDGHMAEVDRVLLRLRLYDAQLQSLGEPSGEHGPIPMESFSNWRLRGGGDDPNDPLLGEPMEQVDLLVAPEDLRPAEAWALAVQGRAEAFLSMVESTETDLNALVEELEDLRALEAALPSVWPAEGDLTSGFGWRRSPVGRAYWRFHSGIDVAARRGAPIVAPAPGRVVFSGWSGGYGRFIEIDHGYGITTTFGHCDRLHVTVGQEVQRGDLIGTVGTTGRSTGPHLHFEVRLDDHPVDPLDYLPR